MNIDNNVIDLFFVLESERTCVCVCVCVCVFVCVYVTAESFGKMLIKLIYVITYFPLTSSK